MRVRKCMNPHFPHSILDTHLNRFERSCHIGMVDTTSNSSTIPNFYFESTYASGMSPKPTSLAVLMSAMVLDFPPDSIFNVKVPTSKSSNQKSPQ